MPKHSDRSEDEEEWLEEELSRGKGKKKKSYGSSEDEGRNDDYSSSSGSDSDGGRRRGGGRSKAAPPPLKKRKSGGGGGGRRASSPSDSSDDGRDDDLDADSGDGFGDDLMGDDDDRAYLSSLTEMERENILNERYEARKKRVERMELRRKLQQSKGTRASARASMAKGTGAKTGVKASALSNLKAKREEKATRAKRRAKEIEDRVDVEGSSDDDDSDQWDRGRGKRAKHDARPAATPSAADKSRAEEERKQEWGEKVEVRQYPTLEEINSVKLGRSLLEKWLDQPFFEKTVPRFFVRVGIGMNREQQNAYRMAQIVVAEKGPRTYTVGKKKTQYMLKLSHGGNSKNFSIEYVSNSPITMPEYERWLREVDKAHMDIPTPADIEARRRDLESTRHYVYTHEDISRMIEEKSQLRARPVNLAATKAHLIQLREAAKDRGTAEEVAKVDAELQRFAELDKRETEKRQKKLKVGDINKRNKAKNIVDSHVTAVIEAKAETDDPFSRRPTAPTFHIFASKPAAPAGSSSSSSSSSSEPVATEATKTPVPAEKAADATPVPNKGKEKEEEDRATEPTAHLQLHDTLDLDIEVNLDDLTSPTTKRPLALPHGANRRSTGGGAEQAAKAKAISLDDYKRRRGLL